MNTLRSFALPLSLGCMLVLAGVAHAQAPADINLVGNGSSTGNSGASKVNTQLPRQSGYIIGPGDVLNINVWREAEISQKLAVRPDGMITLPLIGDIPATGQTPEQLGDVVTQKLKSILTDPQVSVIVAEVHSKFYSVVGQVAKPGEYPLVHPTTVLDAISQAGGFHDFAKTGKMYVLRTENGHRTRVPFNYNAVVKGKRPTQDIEVTAGDVIVVP